MKTRLLWERFLVGCLLLALLTGCARAASETPTPEPTVTPKPTVTPLPFVEGTEFPTGTFESASGTDEVEFREDGTCLWSDGVVCKYAVNGNLYTEMTFVWPTGPQVPATYYWTFDGKNLTFQLWGLDYRPHRRKAYNGQTYLLTGETDVSSKVEGPEFPTGRFVLDGSSFYAIEFDADGTWRDYETDVDVPSVSGKYATNGDLYTEMTRSYSSYPQVPATYHWMYDGKNLTFQLWGADVNAHRKSLFDGQTYIRTE